MDNDKRLELIKVLLKYIIEKNRQEEKFMQLLNENNKLFNIDISPSTDIPIFDITDDKTAEEIYAFLTRTDLEVEELVDEFCKKYNI